MLAYLVGRILFNLFFFFQSCISHPYYIYIIYIYTYKHPKWQIQSGGGGDGRGSLKFFAICSYLVVKFQNVLSSLRSPALFVNVNYQYVQLQLT